jgi:ABC-type nitrate/sulfonate/bicarbonate transport system substrate-binding protein
MRIWLRLGCLAAAVSLILVGSAQAEPLRISYFIWIGNGPFFVAKEKGLFAEEGVDVELINVGGPSTNVRSRRAIAGALSASTVRTKPLARSRSRARSPMNVATGGPNTAGHRVLAALVACRTA